MKKNIHAESAHHTCMDGELLQTATTFQIKNQNIPNISKASLTITNFITYFMLLTIINLHYKRNHCLDANIIDSFCP